VGRTRRSSPLPRPRWRRGRSTRRPGDRGGLVQDGYDFHSRLVRIARHGRLEAIYACVQQQLLLCMSRNLIAREQFYEDLEEHAARHRRLLELVRAGDARAAPAEPESHGQRSFEESRPPRPEG
jgi:DNA-binding GntR family transcriptional regulator